MRTKITLYKLLNLSQIFFFRIHSTVSRFTLLHLFDFNMIGAKLLLASIAIGLVSGATLPTPTRAPIQARVEPNCNTPENRKCWSDGFDIDTDAEAVWPSGPTTTYTLVVAEATMTPDGDPKVMQVINGTYPGPVISASKFALYISQSIILTNVYRLGRYSGSPCYQ